MTAQRITGRQIDQLTEGHDAKIARLIERTIDSINTVEEQLASHLRWIEDAAGRIRRALADGTHLNSLGEFQRNPADADRLIALRAEHWQMLIHLIGTEAAVKVSKREF